MITEKQLSEILENLADSGEYSYSKEGLDIKAKASDNTVSISINYEKPNLVEKEVSEFITYLEGIDDALFVEVCEDLDVHRIQECLDSGNIDSVRAAILKFKQALKKTIQKHIDYYQECLTKFCN